MLRKKIIIWGMGQIFNDNISKIDMEDVVAFVDKDPVLQASRFFNKLVIKPCMINDFNFDFVVIFSRRFTMRIYNELQEIYNIEETKILGWEYYIYIMCYKTLYLSWDFPPAFLRLNISDGWTAALDIGFGLLLTKALHPSESLFPEALKFTGVEEKKGNYTEIWRKMYIDIVGDISRIAKSYNVMFVIDYFMDHTLDEFKKLMEVTAGKTDFVVLTIPPISQKNWTKWNQFDFSVFGEVKKVQLSLTKLMVIDTKTEKEVGNPVIFVATHKRFIMPELSVFRAVQAGNTSNKDLGYTKDDTGDSISQWNLMLNECTVLFWIWKNTNNSIVGLCHYRRYFLKDDLLWSINNLLNGRDCEKILKQYDVIVARRISTYPVTVKDQLKLSVNENVFQDGWDIITRIILEKYPDYLDTFQLVLDGYEFYPYNMFVMRRAVMQEYCEWLFGIILQAVEKIDLTSCDEYSRRILGFFAERLLTVWLWKQNYDITERPVLFWEE